MDQLTFHTAVQGFTELKESNSCDTVNVSLLLLKQYRKKNTAQVDLFYGDSYT